MKEVDPNFESVARAHAGDLFRFAFWLTRDRQQAEDVVQEALLRGWRSYRGLREPGAAKAWLFSIVRNEFYSTISANARHAGHVDVADLEIADERPPAFGLEIRDALKTLPQTYAEPLALQVLGGFSCAEIAEMLETTEGAVMTRLTRARQTLKRLVSAPGARWSGGGLP